MQVNNTAMVLPYPKCVSDVSGHLGYDKIIQRSDAMQLKPLPLLLNQMFLLSLSFLFMFHKLKRLVLCNEGALYVQKQTYEYKQAIIMEERNEVVGLATLFIHHTRA